MGLYDIAVYLPAAGCRAWQKALVKMRSVLAFCVLFLYPYSYVVHSWQFLILHPAHHLNDIIARTERSYGFDECFRLINASPSFPHPSAGRVGKVDGNRIGMPYRRIRIILSDELMLVMIGIICPVADFCK